MGIDHGLGGKDNVKSKQRREKKAKKTRVIAMKALSGGKKRKVIVLDENARQEYLICMSEGRIVWLITCFSGYRMI